MLTVDLECSSQRVVAAVRDVYVTAAAAALRADGWTVATRPAPNLPQFAATLAVETGGRTISLECSCDTEGAWSFRRRSSRTWQCRAERLDSLLSYVEAVSREEVGRE